MQRLFLALVAATLLSTATGCFLPAYSGDPPTRATQLLNTSDDLMQINDEWERIWFWINLRT